MPFLQEIIYKLEEGAWARHVKTIVACIAILALFIVYNLRSYRNFSTPEAMDSAQLARNISEGKGYTTLFVRPLSIYLLQQHNEVAARAGSTSVSTNFDFAQIKTAHPDLENPPVYPLVLAGLMKILPFNYTVETKKSFWSENSKFQRYQPDFLIAVFNEVLLMVVAVLTFFLARKLFDASVAWTAAALVVGCELLWRFSVSGLSTMLLIIIFLGLAWCLLRIEEAAREPQPRANLLLVLAIIAGVLAGAGALTRYAFGWVIIPVVLFLFFFSGPRRTVHLLVALAAFVVVLAPWICRNYVVSGTPFGTAGFAIIESTFVFPRFQLERSLHPDFASTAGLIPYTHKLFENSRDILANGLPKLGGSWASMLFLAGLLLAFRGIPVRRMRYFLLMCLVTFGVAQALGRTQLSEESPEINSENLLVLLAPLVFIYGVGFFFTFLEQMKLSAMELRYAVITVFVVLCCLPMIFTFLPPKTSPIAYPPYYPPEIQQSANWMKENELMMSDVPWAVAWYGHRQCVWLTLDAQDDFFAINDYIKPVQALYLTSETIDAKFVSDWIEAREHSWGAFIVQVVLQNRIPAGFPLLHAPAGYLPERLFLSDWERWKTEKQNTAP
jgi:hypothetical protein